MFYANLLAMRKQRSSLLCHFCTFYPSTHAVKHAFFVFGLIAQRRSGFSPKLVPAAGFLATGSTRNRFKKIPLKPKQDLC